MKNLITYAIWSHSGSKVTLLGGDASSTTFPAGSSFLVLGVEQDTDGSGTATVYLAERMGNAAHPSGALERRILEHLKQKLNDRRGRPKVQVGPSQAFGKTHALDPVLAFDSGLAERGRLIPAPTRSADDTKGPEVR